MSANRKVRRAARQIYRRCLVNGELDVDRARDVAAWIAASQRRGALPLLTDFQRLVRLNVDRHTAIVETAAPLAASLREDIAAGLTHRYGPSLEISFDGNPTLIGGIVIRVGSDVYDGSLRTRLAALQAHL
jgi:F-type H+-transporting ATPase subunit delta